MPSLFSIRSTRHILVLSSISLEKMCPVSVDIVYLFLLIFYSHKSLMVNIQR
jgi:hypothetical protein